MMYHFMLGLRGASAVAVAPSAGACCAPSPVVVPFFSSSCIEPAFPAVIALVVRPECFEQGGHSVLNKEIDDSEIQRENEYRDDDHGRGAADLFPGRSSHLAHFGAHVRVKGFGPFRPGLYLVP